MHTKKRKKKKNVLWNIKLILTPFKLCLATAQVDRFMANITRIISISYSQRASQQNNPSLKKKLNKITECEKEKWNEMKWIEESKKIKWFHFVQGRWKCVTHKSCCMINETCKFFFAFGSNSLSLFFFFSLYIPSYIFTFHSFAWHNSLIFFFHFNCIFFRFLSNHFRCGHSSIVFLHQKKKQKKKTKWKQKFDRKSSTKWITLANSKVMESESESKSLDKRCKKSTSNKHIFYSFTF